MAIMLPLKQSPAPVVSTASTRGAGINRLPSRLMTTLPFSPSVMTTVFTPRAKNHSQASLALFSSSTSMPDSSFASCSFGFS